MPKWPEESRIGANWHVLGIEPVDRLGRPTVTPKVPVTGAVPWTRLCVRWKVLEIVRIRKSCVTSSGLVTWTWMRSPNATTWFSQSARGGRQSLEIDPVAENCDFTCPFLSVQVTSKVPLAG